MLMRSTDAFEFFFRADGQLDRHSGAAEDLVHVFDGRSKLGAFAVELVDQEWRGEA